MNAAEKLALAESAIREEIAQLYRWADESSHGGWSTHQVDPMRRRAEKLAVVLYRLTS